MNAAQDQNLLTKSDFARIVKDISPRRISNKQEETVDHTLDVSNFQTWIFNDVQF